MEKQKIIWSLFDSETAITQELNSEKHKVYSIGLPSISAITDNFIKIDLSKKSCLKKLSKLPKPDYIFASPPCETWVNVNIGNVRFYERNYNEYNLYWQKNFNPNNYATHHRELRLLGQKTAYWTMRIIKEFKPKYWFIENGASSIIFEYLHKYHNLKGYKNRLEYSSYDKNFSMKPTIIYSNKKLLLKRNNVKSNVIIAISKNECDYVRRHIDYKALGYNSPTAYIKNKREYIETYAKRSKVPIELYEDILFQIENNPYPTLF